MPSDSDSTGGDGRSLRRELVLQHPGGGPGAPPADSSVAYHRSSRWRRACDERPRPHEWLAERPGLACSDQAKGSQFAALKTARASPSATKGMQGRSVAPEAAQGRLLPWPDPVRTPRGRSSRHARLSMASTQPLASLALAITPHRHHRATVSGKSTSYPHWGCEQPPDH